MIKIHGRIDGIHQHIDGIVRHTRIILLRTDNAVGPPYVSLNLYGSDHSIGHTMPLESAAELYEALGRLLGRALNA